MEEVEAKVRYILRDHHMPRAVHVVYNGTEPNIDHATAAITALIQEARIEENVRLRRRYNGTNYEKLRATLNYRIEQLSGGSNND